MLNHLEMRDLAHDIAEALESTARRRDALQSHLCWGGAGRR